MLDERALLLKRIADLESENQELSGQEDARILMEKVHKTEIASYKWNIMVEKMVRHDERKQDRVVRLNLRRRNTVLQERLTKFADGQRLRSKAGGARVQLSYEVLQLLSPRTATPVVSDDEGDLPARSSATRVRLERVKTELKGHKARATTDESLYEPGMFGIQDTNRAGTPRDTSESMMRSITKSLNNVTFDEVVKTPEIAPYPYAGFTDQGVPGSHLRKFRPSSIGGTVPIDDGQSLQSINEQWVALFDGGGTDPGYTGAKPASPDSPNREENATKNSEGEVEKDVTAAIPFISARAPGSRRGSRGIRYRHSKFTAEELSQAHQPRAPGSKEDEGPGFEPPEGLCLDSAREMASDGPKPGNDLPRPMVPILNLKGLDTADELDDEPGPETADAGSQRRRLDGELHDEAQLSKFDGDTVPRGELLELKLKHSLQIRAMQRVFEERLQIMNQYWCDKGVTMVDNKTASMSRFPFGNTSRSLPGSRTGYRHGSPPHRQSMSPGRLNTPSRDSPRKFQINWEKTAHLDRNCAHVKPPEHTRSSFTGWEDAPPATDRPSTSDPVYRGGAASLPRPFTSSGVPLEDGRDSVEPRYYRSCFLMMPHVAVPVSCSHDKDKPAHTFANFRDLLWHLIGCRYHAFIYPGRRRLASYTENKRELANHKIKTHEVKHSVKPFMHTGKLGKKLSGSSS